MAPPGIMSSEHLDNLQMPFRNVLDLTAPAFLASSFTSSSSSSFPSSPASSYISNSPSEREMKIHPSVYHDHGYAMRHDRNVVTIDTHFDTTKTTTAATMTVEDDDEGEEEEQEEEEEEVIDINCIDFDDVMVYVDDDADVGDAMPAHHDANGGMPLSQNGDGDGKTNNRDTQRDGDGGGSGVGGWGAANLGVAPNNGSSSRSSSSNVGISGRTVAEDENDDATTASTDSLFYDRLMSTEADDLFHGIDKLDFDLDDFDPSAEMMVEDSFQNFIDETLNNSIPLAPEPEEDSSNGSADEVAHKKEFFLKLLGLRPVESVSEPRPNLPVDDSASHYLDLDDSFYSMEEETPSLSLSSPTSSNDSIDGWWCLENNDSLTHLSSPAVAAAALTNLTSLTTPVSTSSLTSVPAKKCSCPVSDWKNSLLYTTAPVDPSGQVQTILTTSSMTSPGDVNMRSNSCRQLPPSTNADIPYSNGSAKAVGNTSPLYSDNYPSIGLLVPNPPQLRDEGDADELLRWLEEGEERVSTDRSTPTATFEQGEGGTDQLAHVESPSRYPDSKSHIPSVPSFLDLDAFIDLDEYAAESASPSFIEDNNNCNWDDDFDHGLDSKLGFDKSRDIDIKPSVHGSELRFRLSLLDDLSKGFMDDRDLEKRDTSGHDLCPFGFVGTVCRRDCVSEVSSDIGHSPPSPYSISSVQSPGIHCKGAEDSLNLLGLFSDENSSMLMDCSNLAVSSMALL